MAPRTWPGINKPGGHGKIININYSSLGVVDTLDVKYTLNKTIDTNLDTELVKPHIELSRGRRSRKGRDFLADQYGPTKNPPPENTAIAIEDEKENETPVTEEQPAKSSKKKISKAKSSEAIEKSTTKKTKKGKTDTNLSQREELPKKKRRKPNGNGTKTTAKPSKANTKTPVVTEAEDYSLPEGIPRVVHPKSALAPGDLSPLGPAATNRGTPSKYPPVSEEKPSSDVARIDVLEDRNVEGVVGKIERKTMQSIFDEQMQEAACYVDSLVGGKHRKQSATEDTKPPPTVPAVSAAPPLDERRFAEFGKVFSNAMRYNDFIQEDDLFDNVNGLCSSYDCQPFTKEELKDFVGRLIAEDKVMLSDGNFYPI